MSDSIIYVRRKGTQDDPYISITQDLIVKDGKVQLQEIPDDFTHVLVTNPNAPEETYYEIYSGTPNAFQYLVDYNTFGFVLFNNEDNNKELRFQYKGTGIFYLPAGRVWTKESGGDVIETLQDIIDTEAEAIGHLEELNTLVTNAETATNNANIATANTNDAISNANNATINANNAADNANNKAELANTATINANNATTLANDAADLANDKADLANTAAINANDAADLANTKAGLADLAATNAQEVADNYVNRGEYNSGTQYYEGNEVYNSGSSYRAKQNTIGNAPPVYPTVENTYWIMTAKKGSDGAGGDMFRTTYDTNMDGKVNSADVADSVPWSGITSKPSTFTPSAHEHNADQINIADSGNIITATDVEGALQESFTNVGVLANLLTTEKTNLVGAVNEVKDELASHKADNTQQFANIEINKADKTEVNSLATAKANQSDLDYTNASVSSLSNSKVDKGGNEQVTYAMLAQDVKMAITGDSAAVVGTNAVNTTNIVNKAVSNDKINDDLAIYHKHFMFTPSTFSSMPDAFKELQRGLLYVNFNVSSGCPLKRVFIAGLSKSDTVRLSISFVLNDDTIINSAIIGTIPVATYDANVIASFIETKSFIYKGQKYSITATLLMRWAEFLKFFNSTYSITNSDSTKYVFSENVITRIQPNNDYGMYPYAFIKNMRLCCGKVLDTLTAVYTGIKVDGTPTSMKAKFILESGTQSGTVAMIFNPNGIHRVVDITDRAFHLTITAGWIALTLLGNNLGTYYYATLISQALTHILSMDGSTENTVTMSYDGNDVTVTVNNGTTTDTYTGTFTDETYDLSDFIGPYCTLEHYCEGDRNVKAMPMFTAWEVSGTGFRKAKDYFMREDGALNTLPTGQTYVQISNVYNGNAD
jgi:hypothetical protein